MIALVSFLAINASVLVCAKNVEAVSRPEQIVGTWSLVSIYEEDASGEDVDSFGATKCRRGQTPHSIGRIGQHSAANQRDGYRRGRE
jgi:hypothetical protein